MLDRVPFDVAIADPKLLRSHWGTLSKPQQVILKAFNGLQLTEQEILYWSMLQDSCEYDSLGYVTTITPIAYCPRKYDTLVAILGRRSGKTDRISATQMAYEALLGGHMQYVEAKQDVKMLFIAQDIEQAKSHLNFIYRAINSSPMLAKELTKFNADAIKLTNGMVIEPAPPTITSSRGMAVPGWCADETGFWYTDAKSANPDFEIERAVEYAMAQFPDAFKLVTSTPYTKEGMLWKYSLAGTNGCKLPIEDRDEHQGVLVVHAPTAAMENPRITRKRLTRLQTKDPDAFVRESLAKFVDSISGFFKPEVLAEAIDKKVLERPRYPRPGFPEDPTYFYLAAMDPAFRQDKFAFTVMHHERDKGIVQDYFEEWTPEPGNRLNPVEVLSQIKIVLDRYGVNAVYSDQYQLESLQQLALGMGFTINEVEFTSQSKAKLYGSLASLVNQRRIRFVDKPTIFNQLVSLEKRRTQAGTVQINAPPGKYDDAAAAIAICANQCIWMLSAEMVKPPPPLTTSQEGWQQILRRRAEEQGDIDDNDF